MSKIEFKISIFIKEDFTDRSIIDFLSDQSLSISDYSNFLLSRELYNNLAENIIKFICVYDNGFLKPDRCNASEPINKLFDEHKLRDPISWLSQPGGALFFKQIKDARIDGVIENHKFAPFWEHGKRMKPTAAEPLFKGEIVLFFSEKIGRLKGIEYWTILIKEIFKITKANLCLFATTDEGYNNDFKEIMNETILLSEKVKSILVKQPK